MTSNIHGSAKIYQFPRKPLLSGMRRRDDSQPAAGLHDPRLAYVECGSSWYHEAAVQDADRSRKL